MDFIHLIILLATIVTAFLSSIFGMLGGLILMGVLISFLSVGPAMVLHGFDSSYIKWISGLVK